MKSTQRFVHSVSVLQYQSQSDMPASARPAMSNTVIPLDLSSTLLVRSLIKHPTSVHNPLCKSPLHRRQHQVGDRCSKVFRPHSNHFWGRTDHVKNKGRALSVSSMTSREPCLVTCCQIGTRVVLHLHGVLLDSSNAKFPNSGIFSNFHTGMSTWNRGTLLLPAGHRLVTVKYRYG